jgi:hypothetical protein
MFHVPVREHSKHGYWKVKRKKGLKVLTWEAGKKARNKRKGIQDKRYTLVSRSFLPKHSVLD